MTSEEIVKFPEELEKALPVNYRVLLFEISSAPLAEHAVVWLRIKVSDGRVFEAHIPFPEFQVPIERLIEKIKRDMNHIMAIR